MLRYNQRIQNELRRINYGPQNEEPADGVGIVRFIIKCASDPENVLKRVLSLLSSIDKITLDGWLSDEQWASRLPEWFVGACAKPMTTEEAARWLVWWKGLWAKNKLGGNMISRGRWIIGYTG